MSIPTECPRCGYAHLKEKKCLGGITLYCQKCGWLKDYPSSLLSQYSIQAPITSLSWSVMSLTALRPKHRIGLAECLSIGGTDGIPKCVEVCFSIPIPVLVTEHS